MVFNEDSIRSVQTKIRTGKRVSFDYSSTKYEAEMPEARAELASESTSRTERTLVEKTPSWR